MTRAFRRRIGSGSSAIHHHCQWRTMLDKMWQTTYLPKGTPLWASKFVYKAVETIKLVSITISFTNDQVLLIQFLKMAFKVRVFNQVHSVNFSINQKSFIMWKNIFHNFSKPKKKNHSSINFQIIHLWFYKIKLWRVNRLCFVLVE